MPCAPYVLLIPLFAAAMAAPAVFVTSNVSKPDPGNLYLVFGTNQALDTLLDRPEVREAGPFRPPFGRMVTTTSAFHAFLVERHYWILPATQMAELCGIER